MKVQVIHRTEQRDGSMKSTLVATVNTAGHTADASLAYAWECTNNIQGSWSRKEIGQDNPDWNDSTTVEAPLPERVEADGSISTFGHRSTMVGDAMRFYDGKTMRLFLVADFGFDEILDHDKKNEIVESMWEEMEATQAKQAKKAIDNIVSVQAEELPAGGYRIVALMEDGEREVIKKKSTKRPVAVQAHTAMVNGNARSGLSKFFKFAKKADSWDRNSHYKTFSVS